ncbi:hypothetical protein [Wukongibacter sp. M2B1]|uniref:hypothetical protein n=1 Tax=Wukongibacter sp. M2B1 TaxID=3088895 RepID=UPI003D7A19A3
MASEKIKKLLFTILSDENARKEFRANPDKILNEYNLTEKEKDALKKLDVTKIEKVDLDIARDLDSDAIRVHALVLS